jgi:hypothetical protein
MVMREVLYSLSRQLKQKWKYGMAFLPAGGSLTESMVAPRPEPKPKKL